ncbi:hypothetical protein ANCDUO_17092, partial [Ancylostoma duodenale]
HRCLLHHVMFVSQRIHHPEYRIYPVEHKRNIDPEANQMIHEERKNRISEINSQSFRINPAADYLPKAASTSSVNKVIRTADGGRLRVANIYTWGVDSDHEEVLDARNQVNGLDPNRMRSHGLSPQAIRRNELEMYQSRDEYVDERQAYGLSPQPRRRSEGTNVVYSVPANGYSGESPLGSPYTPRKVPTSIQTPVSPYAERREVLPPVPRHQTPPGTRRTETIVDYEKKKQGPPVVRTTVEGKLRMEKIVGADLITVDSCVSSAWTVRDTVTNYKRLMQSLRQNPEFLNCWDFSPVIPFTKKLIQCKPVKDMVNKENVEKPDCS